MPIWPRASPSGPTSRRPEGLRSRAKPPSRTARPWRRGHSPGSLRGRLDEAARLAAEALDTFQVIEARYESARTGLELAAIAAARGDPAAAQTYLADARRLFQATGVRDPELLIQDVAVKLGVFPPEGYRLSAHPEPPGPRVGGGAGTGAHL